MMSLTEAARSLGVAPATLRQQIKNGRLSATKLARDWFVQDAEVERYRRENLRMTAGTTLTDFGRPGPSSEPTEAAS